MLKDKVVELLEGVLKENESLFLIDFSMTPDHKIKIVIDGDHGVTVQDCMTVSRAIEHNIDRDEEDFALEVASAGAASPLKLPRQYRKNLGRTIEVKLQGQEGELEGQLTEATEDDITLEWKAREPKPVGKGKVTVQKKQQIAISDIKEAKVVLKF
ncbi:ribosome maturation factor RimP [Arenibacter nanhaiticus]|uniref:Ribosome maturation factor RimP n=1 Tax=Arenibacter nanhaiticus TaxID=558155 RepID=A0A1M6GLG4_9FLAO|nr:ribosome assembly cofactor RimP [Arenibacter nanhaiticus]SHJ10788.1 ribosome maturation factor RimP [Arenibacter nanhaiticus]